MSAFSSLYNTYSGFRQPAFTITAGTLSITEEDDLLQMKEITAELSTDAETAGLLRFSMVLSSAESEKSTKADAVTGALQIGETVKLKLGYGDAAQTLVFCGYLNELRCRTGGEDDWDLFVEAECLDAKGLMMTRGGLRHSGKTTAQSVVTEILGRSGYSALISSKTISAPPAGWNLPILTRQQNDFALLRDLALKFRYEFYIYGDTAYFSAPRSDSSAVVEFDGSNGIESVERGATLTGQLNSVTVLGWDEKGKRVSSKQTRSGTPGMANTKFTSKLSGADIFVAEPALITQDQAEALAKAEVAHSKNSAGFIRCTCCGLPEVRPGKFVKFSGCGAPFDGSYYAASVTHSFDVDGFHTSFEAWE